MSSVEKIVLELRPADLSDIVDDKGNYKHGVMYFLKSELTGRVDKQEYYLRLETDKKEFALRFKKKMVYVLKRALEYKD